MSQGGEPVRLGIVGVGVIGQRHLQLASAENQCRVVALADPAPAVAEIASSTGVPHYGSFIEMLDCERLEGVIVAAPTQVHAEIGLELVARRIPMLMEKPFTDTLESGVELATAADAANVAISVGHHRRFDPAVQGAREILKSGQIGRLIGVSGIWAVRKPDLYFDVEWRSARGGGPVLINMIHDIDMLRRLCGEVESVYAETTSRNRGLAVEDSGAILLRFASGVRATISFSDAAPSPWGWERGTADNPAIPPSGENCYHFFGSAGSFEFPRIRTWHYEADGELGWGRRILARNSPSLPRAALAMQLQNFCEVVRGEAEPLVGPRDALATLAAAQAVHLAASRGEPVEPAFPNGNSDWMMPK